jgi:hypothetical protein
MAEPQHERERATESTIKPQVYAGKQVLSALHVGNGERVIICGEIIVQGAVRVQPTGVIIVMHGATLSLCGGMVVEGQVVNYGLVHLGEE